MPLANPAVAPGERKARQKVPDSGKLVLKARLNEAMVAAYSRFEMEMKMLDNSDECITPAYYELYSPLGMSKAVDGHCFWRGFAYLTRSFFGESKQE